MKETNNVFDPHKHKELYLSWKKEGMNINGVSNINRESLINYLEDMELGRNVSPSSKKGSRSFGRLRNLKGKLYTLMVLFEQSSKKKDITKANEDDLLKLFKEMRDGKLKSPRTKKRFNASGTYVKVFKAFWHWNIRHSKKKGIEVPDITIDLDSRDEKPKFNYITIDQLKILCENSKLDYKALMMLMFDSGCRSPTELLNIKVSDLEWNNKDNYYMLSIREETSKTFGRKIKLLLCSEILKNYIKQYNLKENDRLFNKKYVVINRHLREIGYKYLKIGTKTDTVKDKRWVSDGLTMYDFRHCSACYWLQRYKSESVMMYRFGWKKSDMIHYYTEYLGLKDTIQEDDLYIDITKTELEKQLDKEKKEREMLQERIISQEKDSLNMKKQMELMEKRLAQLYLNEIKPTREQVKEELKTRK